MVLVASFIFLALIPLFIIVEKCIYSHLLIMGILTRNYSNLFCPQLFHLHIPSHLQFYTLFGGLKECSKDDYKQGALGTLY